MATVRASSAAKLGTRCAGNMSAPPNGVLGLGFACPFTLDSMAGIITLRVVLWMELACEVFGEPTRAF